MKGRVVAGVALLTVEDDDVATALEDLDSGTELPLADRTITTAEPIPFGHKVALRPIDGGEAITKYGETIGRATARIDPGEWVHTHNVESTRGRGDAGTGDADSGDAIGESPSATNGGER